MIQRNRFNSSTSDRVNVINMYIVQWLKKKKKKDGALLTDAVSEFKSVCLLLARFVWSKSNLGGN